jgi:hypothetical protein
MPHRHHRQGRGWRLPDHPLQGGRSSMMLASAPCFGPLPPSTVRVGSAWARNVARSNLTSEPAAGGSPPSSSGWRAAAGRIGRGEVKFDWLARNQVFISAQCNAEWSCLIATAPVNSFPPARCIIAGSWLFLWSTLSGRRTMRFEDEAHHVERAVRMVRPQDPTRDSLRRVPAKTPASARPGGFRCSALSQAA